MPNKSFTLREEHVLQMLEKKTMRITFARGAKEVRSSGITQGGTS
jgi:hypothetical protein